MDKVSRLLDERERNQPGIFPWIVLATLLHAGLASAVFLAAREGSHPPAQLPAVAVRIIRPEPLTRRTAAPAAGPRAVPTAAPEPIPTAAPAVIAPTAAPVATAAAQPVPDPPSSDAMPEAASRATPAPTPPPQPAGGGGGGGRGLSLGGGSGGDSAADIPSDFQFSYYLDRMLALIESRWYKPPSPAGTRARVRFRILSSGRVEAIQLEQSSGQPAFDRAVLRALYAANPLPPLPPAYRKPSLTIHLTFSE